MKPYLHVSLCAVSLALPFAVSAADVSIASSADIEKQCYAVGDTVTVSGGDAAAVLGDGVATLAGQVLTMKHPGFTLLKDSGGTEYVFGVYDPPANGGGRAVGASLPLRGCTSVEIAPSQKKI